MNSGIPSVKRSRQNPKVHQVRDLHSISVNFSNQFQLRKITVKWTALKTMPNLLPHVRTSFCFYNHLKISGIKKPHLHRFE